MKEFGKMVPKLCTAALLILAALASVAPAASAADKPDAAFAKWWQKFQVAVMRNDIRTIDKGAEFPMDWQVSADVRAIRSESDFAANFGIFFTPNVVKNVLAGKPEKLPNGNYVLAWKSGGKEYSMNFRFYNGNYALDGLGDGPR